MNHIGLNTIATRDKIVGDGTVSQCMGTVEHVVGFFADLKFNLHSLVMPEIPFYLIAGCPKMEELETCIDLGNESVSI